jgi:hypothetical protein
MLTIVLSPEPERRTLRQGTGDKPFITDAFFLVLNAKSQREYVLINLLLFNS